MHKLTDKTIEVKGIGPKKSSLFKKLDIYILEDALHYYPREYEKYKAVLPISQIRSSGDVSISASFMGRPRTRYAKGLSITSIVAVDNTGKVECTWFNQPFRASIYKQDVLYYIRGKIIKRNNKLQIQNPIIEEYCAQEHTRDKLVPVYKLTRGLTQTDLQRLINKALECPELDKNSYSDLLIKKSTGFVSKKDAYTNIHYPASEDQLEYARQRLIFSEFFNLQVSAQYIKNTINSRTSDVKINTDKANIESFFNSLPYELTPSQDKVIKNIFNDFNSGKVMNRMIQGDVGSGKTLVAAAALYTVAFSGYQSTMMAPTELLAKQHMKTLSSLLKDFRIHIELLTGSMNAAEKSAIKERLANGKIDIMIGTHALIQDDVIFKSLGLVISDEQQRFGVRERAVLRSKGGAPHFMAMSATPIPRTLAHILYGDLDLSVIKDMPPGRRPIKTYCVSSKLRERVYRFVKNRVKQGEQAYIVCQLIEESSTIDAISAEDLYSELKQGYLMGIEIRLLHGRLETNEKDLIMEEFLQGKTKALVATSIIEVGVDAENATIIVIENAERFGLAQLHQLRGRVGRGVKQSYCILISDTDDDLAKDRLQAMVSLANGFEIAEKDLELRGPGQVYGSRQHGLPEFRMANPIKDSKLFMLASKNAERVIKNLDKIEFRKIAEECLSKHQGTDIISD
ncbi:MAG TPA: ATP-dependent DNA helicase RecG [Bacillota bacterium]|nr:ATP-dependent DNA helicase RecG [Bacillota bacterium]